MSILKSHPKSTRIWTEAANRLLFEQLVARFGPASTWESSASPGNGRDPEFAKFCEAMAIVVGANSAKAVMLRIRFAMPITGCASWHGYGHAQTAIATLAAAYHAGFIVHSEFPDLIAARRGPPPGKRSQPRALRGRRAQALQPSQEEQPSWQ